MAQARGKTGGLAEILEPLAIVLQVQNEAPLASHEKVEASVSVGIGKKGRGHKTRRRKPRGNRVCHIDQAAAVVPQKVTSR